jgi:hypothetical protein
MESRSSSIYVVWTRARVYRSEVGISNGPMRDGTDQVLRRVVMKRLLSLVAVAGLALGGIGIIGCESTDLSSRPDHDELFGVGNGEFGESTAIAGDYPSDLNHQPATPPATQPAPAGR